MALACLASQSCTELGPAQPQLVLSIVVLNMAEYTIISLIMIDFVPIYFIFNLFRRIFQGVSSLPKEMDIE